MTPKLPSAEAYMATIERCENRQDAVDQLSKAFRSVPEAAANECRGVGEHNDHVRWELARRIRKLKEKP